MTDFMPPTSKERGLRSGTVPTPLVVGLGAPCELANREMEYDHQHVKRLSDMLVQVKMMVVMVIIRIVVIYRWKLQPPPTFDISSL